MYPKTLSVILLILNYIDCRFEKLYFFFILSYSISNFLNFKKKHVSTKPPRLVVMFLTS